MAWGVNHHVPNAQFMTHPPHDAPKGHQKNIREEPKLESERVKKKRKKKRKPKRQPIPFPCPTQFRMSSSRPKTKSKWFPFPNTNTPDAVSRGAVVGDSGGTGVAATVCRRADLTVLSARPLMEFSPQADAKPRLLLLVLGAKQLRGGEGLVGGPATSHWQASTLNWTVCGFGWRLGVVVLWTA